MTRLDYDNSDISEAYQAARDLPRESAEMWMQKVESLLRSHCIEQILDLGSGMGRFSGYLAQAFSAHVVGVEPSEKMRDAALRNNDRQDVRFVSGSGESIPLQDGSVDMVFMSMIFHHLVDSDRCLREIHRVLAPDGFLVIRNSTKENLDQVPLLRCFPDARVLEEARMPSRVDLLRHAEQAGFSYLALEPVVQVFASNHLEYLRKVGKRGLSVFKLIPDASFDAGMAKLEEYCLSRADEPALEEIDLFVARRLGTTQFDVREKKRQKT